MMNNSSSDQGGFIMALAGNKCDLDPALHKVNLQTASELAKKYNMILSETSAKTGKGVQELFRKVAEKVVLLKKMQQ
jgi:GTPase SAR1 family protein